MKVIESPTHDSHKCWHCHATVTSNHDNYHLLHCNTSAQKYYLQSYFYIITSVHVCLNCEIIKGVDLINSANKNVNLCDLCWNWSSKKGNLRVLFKKQHFVLFIRHHVHRSHFPRGRGKRGLRISLYKFFSVK